MHVFLARAAIKIGGSEISDPYKTCNLLMVLGFVSFANEQLLHTHLSFLEDHIFIFTHVVFLSAFFTGKICRNTPFCFPCCASKRCFSQWASPRRTFCRSFLERVRLHEKVLPLTDIEPRFHSAFPHKRELPHSSGVLKPLSMYTPLASSCWVVQIIYFYFGFLKKHDRLHPHQFIYGIVICEVKGSNLEFCNAACRT